MIKVKTLIALLQRCHPDACVYAYEGEDTGIAIHEPSGECRWIRATEDETEDVYTDGFDLPELKR